MEKQQPSALHQLSLRLLRDEAKRRIEEDENTCWKRGQRYPRNIFTQTDMDSASCEQYTGRSLIPHLWREGELACLFGAPNVGKTVLARQFMLEIAENTTHNVAYFDLENNTDQFVFGYTRLRGLDTYKIYPSDNTTIYRIDSYSDERDCHTDEILRQMESLITAGEHSVVIIDDISHICSSGNSERATRAMRTLKRWTLKYRIAILVIAHSHYRQPDSLLSLRQLGTNPEYAYTFDSIFAIERTSFYRSQRVSHYVKQLKNRLRPVTYDENSVLPLSLRRIDNIWIGFRVIEDTGNEHEYLRAADPFVTEGQIADMVIDHAAKYHSVRYIAQALHISKSRVQRIIDANRQAILDKIRQQPYALNTDYEPEPEISRDPGNPAEPTARSFFYANENPYDPDAPCLSLAPVQILTTNFPDTKPTPELPVFPNEPAETPPPTTVPATKAASSEPSENPEPSAPPTTVPCTTSSILHPTSSMRKAPMPTVPQQSITYAATPLQPLSHPINSYNILSHPIPPKKMNNFETNFDNNVPKKTKNIHFFISLLLVYLIIYNFAIRNTLAHQ